MIASSVPRFGSKFVSRLRAAAATVGHHPWTNWLAVVEGHRERRGFPVADDHHPHIEAAIDWLVHAQNSSPDEGVARGYSVTRTPYFGRRGWQPSYPETTGYIIPTLFDAAAFLGRPELRERAVRAARWESEIQLPSGAVQGGVIGQPLSPAVFNSGQVLLGWIRAYRETGDESFAEAAHGVSRFLAETLGEDGLWHSNNSKFSRASSTLYNARAAWALAEAGALFNQPAYADAAARNLRAVADRQQPNGWFPDCCLSDPTRPLLHTISYTVRGLLEGGRVLEDADLVESAAAALKALRDAVRSDGWMPGRYQSDWSGAVSWSCLTGQAQTANNWLRLGLITGDPTWFEAVPPVVRFLKSTQNRTAGTPGLRGGIKGSAPLGGGYGPYQVLSWATKFFADALIREERINNGSLVAADGEDATT